LTHVDQSTLSGFTLKNSPFRTFSVLNSVNTVITGLTLDSKAGNGQAKNTDGFDLSRNNGVSITNNTVYNQDDCLAMQSSVNTLFAYNSCTGGHGVSIGSLGGAAVDVSSTVNGLTVTNCTVSRGFRPQIPSTRQVYLTLVSQLGGKRLRSPHSY
ncbi:hypothetical protein LEN26_005300, partial [Aphanomyces euteiches]